MSEKVKTDKKCETCEAYDGYECIWGECQTKTNCLNSGFGDWQPSYNLLKELNKQQDKRIEKLEFTIKNILDNYKPARSIDTQAILHQLNQALGGE